MKLLKVGKGNLSRNEWRSGSSSLSCWREVGAPGFEFNKIRKLKLFERNPADVYLTQPGLRQSNSAPRKYNMLVMQAIVPISCLCVIKENTQGLGNILYIYKDNWPPPQNILHSWSSHSGKSPRNRHSDKYVFLCWQCHVSVLQMS